MPLLRSNCIEITPDKCMQDEVCVYSLNKYDWSCTSFLGHFDVAEMDGSTTKDGLHAYYGICVFFYFSLSL